MEELAQIEINKVLVSVNAVRLSGYEVSTIEAEFDSLQDEQEYFNAAYRICQQRNYNRASSYGPLKALERLAEKKGITLESSEPIEKPAVVPFMCGGL